MSFFWVLRGEDFQVSFPEFDPRFLQEFPQFIDSAAELGKRKWHVLKEKRGNLSIYTFREISPTLSQKIEILRRNISTFVETAEELFNFAKSVGVVFGESLPRFRLRLMKKVTDAFVLVVEAKDGKAKVRTELLYEEFNFMFDETVHKLDSDGENGFYRCVCVGDSVYVLILSWSKEMLILPFEEELLRDFLEHLALSFQMVFYARGYRDANAVKRKFFIAVSHEVRTILTTIIGFSEMALRKISQNSAREYVEKVVKAGYELREVMDRIINYAEITGEKVKIVPSLCDVGKLLYEVVEEKCGEEVETQIVVDPSVPVPFVLDPDVFKKVLRPLLDNAVKFGEGKPIGVGATVFYTSDRVGLLSFVGDRGCGVEEDQKDAIFQPFFRSGRVLKGARGLGLGLAEANVYAKLLGGRLDYESAIGKGSVFYFWTYFEKRSVEREVGKFLVVDAKRKVYEAVKRRVGAENVVRLEFMEEEVEEIRGFDELLFNVYSWGSRSLEELIELWERTGKPIHVYWFDGRIFKFCGTLSIRQNEPMDVPVRKEENVLYVDASAVEPRALVNEHREHFRFPRRVVLCFPEKVRAGELEYIRQLLELSCQPLNLVEFLNEFFGKHVNPKVLYVFKDENLIFHPFPDVDYVVEGSARFSARFSGKDFGEFACVAVDGRLFEEERTYWESAINGLRRKGVKVCVLLPYYMWDLNEEIDFVRTFKKPLLGREKEAFKEFLRG